MNVKKLSPVAEFLKANCAKAKNHNTYRAQTGDIVSYCEFYNPQGQYLGQMTRIKPHYGDKPSFAYLKSYIQTMESGYKEGYRQVKENVIHFAKILGLKDGQEASYLPEKMVKKQIVINNQGYKTEDVFERTISSNMTLLEKADPKAYGYVPQNTYRAEEPIIYQEVQTLHQVTNSDKF